MFAGDLRGGERRFAEQCLRVGSTFAGDQPVRTLACGGKTNQSRHRLRTRFKFRAEQLQRVAQTARCTGTRFVFGASLQRRFKTFGVGRNHAVNARNFRRCDALLWPENRRCAMHANERIIDI